MIEPTITPNEGLPQVVDAEGNVWTRYHTDPTGKGCHWWSYPGGGWKAFKDLDDPRPWPEPSDFGDTVRKKPCADPLCATINVHPEHPKPVTARKPNLRTQTRALAMEWACDEESLKDAYHVRYCPGCNNASRILKILEETK